MTVAVGARCASKPTARDASKDREWHAANTVNQAERQAETVPGAVHRGEPWTAADMEVAMRDDLTITDLALLLGRTRAAVFYVRHKIRHDPRYARAAGISRAKA